MLLVRLGKDIFVVQQVLDLGEERLLFVIVVGLDKLEPGLGVSHKVCLVGPLDQWGLVVDGVVSTEDRVVQQAHVRRTGREEVGLFSALSVEASSVGPMASKSPGTWLTFLVTYCGVGMSFIGPSAHGFVVCGVVVIMNGDLDKSKLMRMLGITSKRYPAILKDARRPGVRRGRAVIYGDKSGTIR